MTLEVLPVRFPSGDGECGGDLYLPNRSPEAAVAPTSGTGDRLPRSPAGDLPPPSGAGDRPPRSPAGDLPPPSPAATEGSLPPPPVVVMAHGIGAERAFGLEWFAHRFAERGLAVLAFDYRGFGDSSGEPRYLVSPRGHVADYLAAMDFVRGHDAVDGSRIALWGTSFSGGHVLEVAARGPAGLRAVVSQIPFVSGIASTLVFPLRYQLPAVVLGVADLAGSLLGRGALTVPVVRDRGLALLPGPDARKGYEGIVPEETEWPGRLPARVFLSVLTYRPLSRASKVAVPTLVVAGRDDAICPIGAVRKAARRIPRCRLEELPIGHFEAYFEPWFDQVAEMEADFLEAELRGAGTGAATG